MNADNYSILEGETETNSTVIETTDEYQECSTLMDEITQEVTSAWRPKQIEKWTEGETKVQGSIPPNMPGLEQRVGVYWGASWPMRRLYFIHYLAKYEKGKLNYEETSEETGTGAFIKLYNGVPFEPPLLYLPSHRYEIFHHSVTINSYPPEGVSKQFGEMREYFIDPVLSWSGISSDYSVISVPICSSYDYRQTATMYSGRHEIGGKKTMDIVESFHRKVQGPIVSGWTKYHGKRKQLNINYSFNDKLDNTHNKDYTITYYHPDIAPPPGENNGWTIPGSNYFTPDQMNLPDETLLGIILKEAYGHENTTMSHLQYMSRRIKEMEDFAWGFKDDINFNNDR
jgi:hypothetical protein